MKKQYGVAEKISDILVHKFFSSDFLESNQDLEHFITFPRVVRVKPVVNVRSYVTLQLDEGIYLLTRLYK